MADSVTMADLAHAAGVHQGTVSRALNNNPRISEETRRRIQRLAREMGYTPNPLVSALMATRRKRKADAGSGNTLALLTTGESRTRWRESSVLYAAHYRAIRQHADTRGYITEEFWLDQPGMSPARMRDILKHRGIRGVLVCPLAGQRHRLNFDFSPFAAVTMGNTLQDPQLDHVSIDYSTAMKRLITQLKRERRKRIAFLSPTDISDRVGHLSLGAFLAERHFSPQDILPPLTWETYPASKQILEWILTQQPDAIITPTQFVYDSLAKSLCSLPHGLEKPDLLCADCHLDSTARGIARDADAEAAAAVELLTQRVERGVRGLPVNPQTILISGHWYPGKNRKTNEGQLKP